MLQHSAFKITTYMQSMICLMSQNVVFNEASSLLKELLNISLSAKQCQRVSQWYGDQINPIINANQIDFIPQLSPPKKDDICYVMMDGCMWYTRDDGWKENKLARIFYDRENIKIQENRNEIVNTVYVSHLGGIDKFLPKLERHTALLKTPKVFIADGAKWIWNWVDNSYPGCVQILDYYHAVEKLEAFAKIQFSDQINRKEWMAIQKELLMIDRVEDVILNIRKTRSVNTSAKELKMKVIRYYVEHEDRMQYKTFRDKGLLIGSGPMEAAHRNVTQQRMKLSGQKWSIKGANAIANLRCYQKSNKWGIINDLIKIAA